MATYQLEKIAERKAEKSLELTWEGKTALVIPPPELWPDAAVELGQTGDAKGALVAVVGQDNYDKFVELTNLGASAVWAAVVDHYQLGDAADPGK